jgi:hypothetical protein
LRLAGGPVSERKCWGLFPVRRPSQFPAGARCPARGLRSGRGRALARFPVWVCPGGSPGHIHGLALRARPVVRSIGSFQKPRSPICGRLLPGVFVIPHLLPVLLPERFSRFGCRQLERKKAASISAVMRFEDAGFLVLGDLRVTRERERAGEPMRRARARSMLRAEQGKQAGGGGATKPARSGAHRGRLGERHTCQRVSREPRRREPQSGRPG